MTCTFSVRTTADPTRSTRAAVAAVVATVCLFLPVAPAAADPAGRGSVDSFYGAMTLGTPIAVPPFHGIEPKLSLAYSSSQGLSWLGHGWSLQGLSRIELRNEFGAIPTMNHSDPDGSCDEVAIVPDAIEPAPVAPTLPPAGPETIDGSIPHLDGQQLVPCTNMGSTHCTKNDSYMRIRYDAPSDRWTVQDATGTVRTYQRVIATTWVLTAVVDVNGNTALYDYALIAGVVYPNSIRYNIPAGPRADTARYQVRFERSPRDPEQRYRYTTGAGFGRLATACQQLDAIAVDVHALPGVYHTVRRYALAYRPGATPGRLLLESVQQLGVGDALGLPAQQFQYDDPALDTLPLDEQEINLRYSYETPMFVGLFHVGDGHFAPVRLTLSEFDPAPRMLIHHGALVDPPPGGGVLRTYPFDLPFDRTSEARMDAVFVDLDGNGRDDVVAQQDGVLFVKLFRMDEGWLGPYLSEHAQFTYDLSETVGIPDHVAGGDFDGDGRGDLLIVGHARRDVQVWWGRGDGTFTVVHHPSYPAARFGHGTLMFGDFNGDGLANDFLDSATGRLYRIMRTPFVPDTPVVEYGARFFGEWPADAALERFAGDFNGDGVGDVLERQTVRGEPRLQMHFGDGQGRFESRILTDVTVDDERLFARDFTGDGVTDIALIDAETGQTRYVVFDYAGNVRIETGASMSDDPAAVYLPTPRCTDGCRHRAWMMSEVVRPDPDYPWGLVYRNVPGPALQRAELLTAVDNGLGVSTAIDYRRILHGAGIAGRRHRGMSTMVVDHMTTTAKLLEGAPQTSTKRFEYDGALWSFEEHRFLGFRWVKEAIDGEDAHTETYFLQRNGTESRPERVYVVKENGGVASLTIRHYDENNTPPYRSRLTEEWTYTDCDITPSPYSDPLDSECAHRRVVARQYTTQTGKPSLEIDSGDYDLTGDESATQIGYTSNAAAGLYDLPEAKTVYLYEWPNGELRPRADGTYPPESLARRSEYRYDGATDAGSVPSKGMSTTLLRWDDQSGKFVATHRTYDAHGNAKTETDARGATTEIDYDTYYEHYPETTCNALGHCTTDLWNAVAGDVATHIDENGRRTTYHYDAHGRRIRVVHPKLQNCTGVACSLETEYVWTTHPGLGLESLQIAPDEREAGQWTRTFQDGLGRIARVEKPGAQRKDTYFVGTSNLVERETMWYVTGHAPQVLHHEYDFASRRTLTRRGDSTVVTTYNGRTTTVRNWRSPSAPSTSPPEVTTLVHNARGELAEVIERYVPPEGGGTIEQRTTYFYDAFGRLRRIVDFHGNVTLVEYDSLDRKILTCDQDSGCWSYAHEPDGMLHMQVDARGATTTFEYDILGRVTSKTADGVDGATDDQVYTWKYDEPGHGYSIAEVTSVKGPGFSRSSQWDRRGLEIRQTTCIEDACRTFQREHDRAGRLQQLVYPDGETVVYHYDDAGRLHSMASIGPAGVPFVTDMLWTAGGQVDNAHYGNGAVLDIDYDPATGWPAYAEVRGPAGLLYDGNYVYDDAGRLLSVSSTTHDSEAYRYDNLGRLREVAGDHSQSFDYDAIGNMTFNSALGAYGYADAAHVHAVTSAGAASYSYDANGNMLAGGGRALSWDAGNRLATVSRDGATTRFGYDEQNQRLVKAGPGGTTRYFGRLREERDGHVIHYYWAGATLVAHKERDPGAAPQYRWYHQDGSGNTRVLSDGDGVAAASYEYEPFGGHAMSKDDVGPRFGGHHDDPASGLIYMGARYYDPALARFISSDAVIPEPGVPQSLNRYSYSANDPVNNVDPSGHSPFGTFVIGVLMASSASNPTLAGAILVGTMIKAMGEQSGNDWLNLSGSMILGIAAGVINGGGGELFLSYGVTAWTHPASPLPNKARAAIALAYTAHNWLSPPEYAQHDPRVGEGVDMYMQGRAEGNAALSQAGLDRIAASDPTVKDMAELRSQLDKLPVGRAPAWHVGTKAQYAAARLVSERTGVPISQIMAMSPNIGIVGPGADFGAFGRALGWVTPIGVHGVVHDADGYLFTQFGIGGGYAAAPHLGLFPGNPFSGQLLGIAYQWTRFNYATIAAGFHPGL